jgi:hypothetical protein
VVLQIDVTPGQAAAVTVIAPTPIVTIVNTPLPLPTATEVVTATDEFTEDGFPRFSSWLLAMVILIVSAAITFLSMSQIRSVQWSIRWTICLFLGGLAAYNYAAFGLPGSQASISEFGFSAILIMLVVGMGFGLLAGRIWERRSSKTQKANN